MTIKKRFIAGARCTKCNAMDRVVMLTSATDEWIECIECGYTEKRPTEVASNTPPQPDDVGVVQFKPPR